MPILFKDGHIVFKNGHIVFTNDGEENPCGCCEDPGPDPDPAVPCDQCDTDRTPAIVQLIVGGIANGSCACGGLNGTFDLPQVIGTPCNWILNGSFGCGYDKIVASALGFGGFVTTYTIEVANTTNGRKFSLLKNVFGAGNNDCLTHFNNGGWTLTDNMSGDCNLSGMTYSVAAF